MESVENEEINNERKLDFIEKGIICVLQLRDYVSQIIRMQYSKNYYNIDSYTQVQDVLYLPEYLTKELDEIINKPENHIRYYFYNNEIESLLNQSPRTNGCDLTERYINEKFFYYMKQCWLKKEWDIYELLPDNYKLLEQAVTIIAQSIQLQKNLYYLHIKESLDNIVQEILNCLKEKHPNHPIFSISAETRIYWENNNIDENHWNEKEGTQIMDTFQEYIFGKLNFQSNGGFTSEDMCIDNVLRKKSGDGLIILIIYQSVARRLGLRCNIIDNCPYYIFWKPKYTNDGLENVRYLLVERQDDSSWPTPLLSDFHEFYKMDVNKVWNYLKNQFQKNVGLANTIFKLESNAYAIRMFKLHFAKPICRNTGLKDAEYAVGMIIEHRALDGNKCTGVILAWHRCEDGHLISKGYDDLNCVLRLNHNESHSLNRGLIIYVVLGEHNKMCYVQEDYIVLTKPRWIANDEIGRYFCKFKNTHYKPNEMLANLFPDDAAVRKRYLNEEDS
ncbi:F-box only protein 21-like isoform X2 [Nylanderia fulva]|nr:F-box only protein 21-like isoform X2 [Nylanderia fulva]